MAAPSCNIAIGFYSFSSVPAYPWRKRRSLHSFRKYFPDSRLGPHLGILFLLQLAFMGYLHGICLLPAFPLPPETLGIHMAHQIILRIPSCSRNYLLCKFFPDPHRRCGRSYGENGIPRTDLYQPDRPPF